MNSPKSTTNRAVLAILALLSPTLLASIVYANVYAYTPLRAQLIHTPPPLIIVDYPVNDDETLASTVGVNQTSYVATAKALNEPSTICNPYIAIAATTGTGYAWPFCWLPISINLTVTWSPVSQDPYGGSILFYNDTGATGGFIDTLVFYGYALQSFVYPGGILGANPLQNNTVALCYNATLQYSYRLIGGASVTLYIAILNATGSVLDYTAVAVIPDNTWHCLSPAYTYRPADLNMTPGLYWLLIAYAVAVWGIQPTANNIYLHIDTVSHTINLTGPGIYYTNPIIYIADTSIVDFNASLTLEAQTQTQTLIAWISDPFSRPVSTTALVYTGTQTLPLEGAEGNLTRLLGVGYTTTYALLATTPATTNMTLNYYHTGVKVSYPLDIAALDPPQNKTPTPQPEPQKPVIDPVKPLQQYLEQLRAKTQQQGAIQARAGQQQHPVTIPDTSWIKPRPNPDRDLIILIVAAPGTLQQHRER